MVRDEPLVTILLPFVSVNSFLSEAVHSILYQDYSNFQLLLLDNQPLKDAIDLPINDPRAKVVDCRSSKSLSEVLNQGIKLSSGDYIARMDSDDISLPTRIGQQVNFLECNQEVGIVGTGVHVISEEGLLLDTKLQPATHYEILEKLANKNPFFHPTVMFRTRVLTNIDGPYNRTFIRSQDFELWTRLLRVTKGANIQEPLLCYREHENQSGKKIPFESVYFYRLAQLKSHLQISQNTNLALSLRRSFFLIKQVTIAFSKFAFYAFRLKLKALKRRIQ
jgi:glycosyltransferase involved in cell wall biosynthesis